MKMTIDRFEGDMAVLELEDGRMQSVCRTLLPSDAREGDVLEIRILPQERKAREARIKQLMNEVFE